MSPTFYLIIHLVGISGVALGVGGMIAGGSNRRLFAMWQGIGLFMMLVSGFGLLAKMHLGFPHFAMVKLVLWFVLGMLPLFVRKLKISPVVAILISLALVTALAWLGVVKPALW